VQVAHRPVPAGANDKDGTRGKAAQEPHSIRPSAANERHGAKDKTAQETGDKDTGGVNTVDDSKSKAAHETHSSAPSRADEGTSARSDIQKMLMGDGLDEEDEDAEPVDVGTEGKNTAQETNHLDPTAASDVEERLSVRSEMLMGDDLVEEDDIGPLSKRASVATCRPSNELEITPHSDTSVLMEAWMQMEQEDGSASQMRTVNWDDDGSSTTSTATCEPSAEDPPSARDARNTGTASATIKCADEYHRLLLEWVKLQEGEGSASRIVANDEGVDPMKKVDAFGGTKEMEEVEKDFAQALRGQAGGSTALPPPRPAGYLESHGEWLRVMNRQRTCYLYVHTYTQLQRSTRPDGAGP